MAQNLSGYDALLKEFYAPAVQDYLNTESIFFNQIKVKKGLFSGRRVVTPLRATRNDGIGARADGGTLPTAGQSGYVDQLTNAKYNYARIEVTLPTIVASRDDRGAFERAVSAEIKYVAKDFMSDLNRQLFGAHSLFAVNAQTTNSTSLTAKDAYDANVGTTGGAALRYVYGGMAVDIYDPTLATKRNSSDITISSVSTTNNFVILSAQQSLTANDVVVRRGTVASSATLECEGLLDALGTGTSYQGITRASYPEIMTANILANGGTGRAITDALLQQGVDRMNEKGKGELGLLIAHHSVRREYLKTLTPDKRYMDLSLKGGHKVLSFNDKAFWFDKDCPYRKAFELDLDTWSLFIQQDWSWADQDGAVLSRVANSPSFEAFGYLFGNLACHAIAANARIDDITAVEV